MNSREGQRSANTPLANLCFLLFVLLIPEVEGGALLHSGVLVALTGCTFEYNMAGEDGLAIMSLGTTETISALSFRNNSFFCHAGKYGLTEDSELVEVRPCPTRCTNLSGSSHYSSDFVTKYFSRAVKIKSYLLPA